MVVAGVGKASGAEGGQAGLVARGGELARAGGAKAAPGPGARRLQLIDSNLRSGSL